ncbi:GNAT family N-acetyltransferase [Hymenobacter metallilatus]|uniref:GNAT family N-acetyltransferase n=1 Tax=Hymenobacter metallilatus TaxID=2493666 RepID=A0A428JMM0_9BACT|nr:GNAT family N-acetyltransferase [Hymenobacter metallilatus]RSK34527.1 GNAT family N-acetyltransferase [Hymenobacter metallilatus]
MLLRRATAADAPRIGQLFYDTITQVNAADYTPAQVAAWRAGWQNLPGWAAKIEQQYFLVAEATPDTLGGFASLASDGYLDFLFVSAAHQRQGIARQLLTALLEQAVRLGLSGVHTDASSTARPFFSHHGFRLKREQELVVRGVRLTNYRMNQLLAPPLRPTT